MINHNGVTTNTNNNVVVTKLQNQQSREMQEPNFGIIEGNLINFDGIKTSQHMQFVHIFPYLQSNMYKATNGAIAYCLDAGLYGASGTDNAYNNTNGQLSASTLYMLANGYNGSQESLNRFTKWEGWGFTPKEAFEATQLAIWASDNAKPDCRINLNDLYYTDTQGKAVIQAAKELYNEAQNASTNLTINGNLHFAQVNGSEETYGPFTVSAGLPLSSYTVSVSGNPTAEVVNANGQAITGPISAGTPFYIKVSNQNVAKTTISVTATTAIKNGVIQSNGQNYYQNYANETSANVTLSNSLNFEPKVAPIKNTPKPAPKPAPKKVTPAPAPKVTNSNVNKPSNKNEQHQSQTQTINNKPSVKNSNTASPKNTNKENQQQSSKVNNHPTINNHPTNKEEQQQTSKVNNHPVINNHPTVTNKDEQHQSSSINNHPIINNKPTNKQSIDNHPTNTNKNDITVSPNQSNKNTFSPVIKINIYNDNNNSNANTNANANGNGSKATGNSNANSNTNANGNGTSVKADSITAGGNANSNANANANSNSNSNTVKVSKGVISTSTSISESPASASASASVSTPGSSPVSVSASSPVATSAGTTASASATTPAATPADASSTVVSGSQTTGLPFTGLTTSQVSSHANSDLAYGGLFAILAVIASIFGIKKFK